MNIHLPDLKIYRNRLENKGLALPLKTVPFFPDGILAALPSGEGCQKAAWPWCEQTNPNLYGSKNSWPKISIITPSYNQGAFLEETIRSILLQNYPNLEYIIIDGGSTDNTAQILEKYSPWISYWHSVKDEGQSNAINMGFSLASGDYYAWINSDDFYLKDIFKLIADTFLDSNAKFVYGYAYELDVTSKSMTLIRVPPLQDYFLKIPTLLQSSTFWCSEIHVPIWEEMHCAMDYELWLRLVKGNKRRRIRLPLSVAQKHEDAKTYDPKMAIKWKEDQQRMWAENAHGIVHEWKRIKFFNRIRMKLYALLKIL